MHYKHVYINEDTWKPRQYLDDGRSRFVDINNIGYTNWITEGNIPEVIEWIPPSKDIIHEDPWDAVRSKRNQLLLLSDWTQLPDVPLDTDTIHAWQTYRQSLRDITEQLDPSNIYWPESP